MSDEVRVNWKEVYDIETPTSIVIGDPSYFEEMEDPKVSERVKNNMKKLTLIKGNIPKTHKARLIFSELECEGFAPDKPFFIHEAKIVICNAKYLDVYCNDQYYPSQVIEDTALGCDVAQYNVYINYGEDNRYYNVHTGADGMYGSKQINKGAYGFNCSFTFPSDLINEKEMRQILAYLFKCEAIKK